MASASTRRFTVEGPLRGRCGHKHRDLESAFHCWAVDEAVCAQLGQHTDRRIVAVVRGGRQELTSEEQTLVAALRAAWGS